MLERIYRSGVVLYAVLLAWAALHTAVSGCTRMCTEAGCVEGLTVELQPEIPSTYDVELVLDGVRGAFTCTKHEDGGRQVTNETGEVPIWRCVGSQFEIANETPKSVQITVTAQDIDWTGSVDADPDYEVIQPNGPSCTPTCSIASFAIQAE